MQNLISQATRSISGFVLAGGKSHRMGCDKCQIPWGSGTLLTHAVDLLRTISVQVFAVGSEMIEASVPAIADLQPGIGPMAGIQAALLHAQTPWNLVLAVDLPLITPELLSFIVECAEGSGRVAVIPEIAGRLQPLCGLYHRNLLPQIIESIKNGELSIHRLLERLSTGMMDCNQRINRIREQEFIARGFSPEMFINVNTPEDLARARRFRSTLHGDHHP